MHAPTGENSPQCERLNEFPPHPLTHPVTQIASEGCKWVGYEAEPWYTDPDSDLTRNQCGVSRTKRRFSGQKEGGWDLESPHTLFLPFSRNGCACDQFEGGLNFNYHQI